MNFRNVFPSNCTALLSLSAFTPAILKRFFFARLFSGSKIKSDFRSCRDGKGEKEAKVGSKGGCSRGKTKIISCISAFLQGEREAHLNVIFSFKNHRRKS